MIDQETLHKQIDIGLNTGQLGTPVAIRIVAHLPESLSSALALDRWVDDNAARWLQATPVRTESADSQDGNSRTRLIAYEGGQSALLSTGTAVAGQELLQITIFGNHGMLTWQSSHCLSGNGAWLPNAVHACRDENKKEGACPHFRMDSPRRIAIDLVPEPVRSSAPVRPAKQPPYGVLLVAGHHTHQPMYAPSFQADDRCRLVGLTDAPDVSAERQELNRRLAAELKIPVLSDFQQAISREDVDIVSICAEPIRRGPLVVQAAQAGKSLYLDKPLAGSLADLDHIVESVAENGVLAHMFSSLTAPPMARLKRILETNTLGDLHAVHFDVCFAKGRAGTACLGQPRRESYPPTCFEVADAKRELTNVGVYPLVQLAAWLDRPIHRVAATTGNYFFAEHQTRDMEDFGQLWIELDGSLLATCTAGRTGWQSHAADGLNRITLIGSKGVEVIDAHWPRLEIWSDSPGWKPPPVNPPDPMGMWVVPPESSYRPAPKNAWLTDPALSAEADVSYFLDCLQSGCETEASVQATANASRILMAAYRSAATGVPVSFPS